MKTNIITATRRLHDKKFRTRTDLFFDVEAKIEGQEIAFRVSNYIPAYQTRTTKFLVQNESFAFTIDSSYNEPLLTQMKDQLQDEPFNVEPTKSPSESLGAIELIGNADRHEVEERFSQSRKYNYTEFCICCGRGIKGEPKHFIWTIEGPSPVPVAVTEEQMNAVGIYPQGAFPIGSECKKRYPAEYIGNY